MAKRGQLRFISASSYFDAASRSPEAQERLGASLAFSPNAAIDGDARLRIAQRARKEVANNSWAYGMIQTLADDTIGTGPRLQHYLHDSDDDIIRIEEMLQRRERRFRKWAREIRLTEKLKLARMSKAVDGEVFLIIRRNERKKILDVMVFETEHVASEYSQKTAVAAAGKTEIEGIVFDEWRNPVKYRVLKRHPGDDSLMAAAGEAVYIDAESVIHYRNIIRPAQTRGLSEIVSSLRIFNDLRRYSNAVIKNAEQAASLSFVLQTDIAADTTETDYFERPGDEEADGSAVPADDEAPGFQDVIEVEPGTGFFLPDGWKAQQLKAEQPVSSYAEFLDSKLNEAARALSMPFNIAKGNSSRYNYASGRLDHQTYHKKIKNERELIADEILIPLLDRWQEEDEARNPADYDIDGEIEITFVWDAFEHVDPIKEANAMASRLAIGVTTLEDECAKEGKDYTDVLKQRQKEILQMRDLGIPPPAWADGGQPAAEDDEEDEKEESEDNA